MRLGGPDGGRPPGLSPRDSYSCYIVACLMLVQCIVHGVVLLQCCMLCHIVVQVNVLLFNVVSVFFASVGAIFCESGHDFGLYCFLLLTILLLDSIVLIATC